MLKGAHKQRIPNSHTDPVHISLLRELLKQAHITPAEWDDA
jgi:hypothetical protein